MTPDDISGASIETVEIDAPDGVAMNAMEHPGSLSYSLSSKLSEAVDICFQCVRMVVDPEFRDKFAAMTRDELDAWVTRQYAIGGFDIGALGCRMVVKGVNVP